MTDLITRAKEYLAQTEGITQGEWLAFQDRDTIYYEKGHNTLVVVKNDEKQEGYIKSHSANNSDIAAVNLTPTARKLILELANEVMILRQWVDLEPKKGFDDEIEIYKRLANA